MKDYRIEASKEIVAKFSMDYSVYKMRFNHIADDLVEWIVEQHPELKDVPYEAKFPGNDIVIYFYSVGNLVINSL